MEDAESAIIIDSDPLRRNRVAKALDRICGHVEPYESLDELRTYWPHAGIVLAHDDGGAIPAIFDLMSELGYWMPVIAYASNPQPTRVADVILMGAMDFFGWPIPGEEVAARLELLGGRREAFNRLRQRSSRSRKLIGVLSAREREVLFCLAGGASNKVVAKNLQLSPRTVEIHRANMMDKLGVNHLGEAISIALYADLSPGQQVDDRTFDPLVLQQ